MAKTSNESPASLDLSVIVPVYNGRALLERSLAPLLTAQASAALEVIVVDDGSSDGSGSFAQSLGARVVPSGGTALGPAAARNRGADEARGAILLFVDADVVVDGEAIQRVLTSFEDESLGALFGSYDASPPERNHASLYMNLRHHHGHREASEDASTFWTGLGAVRRVAFLGVHGFDLVRFPHPSVEDVDLGQRLRAAGTRIRRDPLLRGTHLKRWSWWGVVHTDIVRRAKPWAEMMIANPGQFTDLNVGRTEQIKALLAGAWLASLALALACLLSPWIPLALFALVLVVNRSLLVVFLRGGGALFALVGIVFQQLHFVYASATYVLCRLRVI